MSLSLPVRTRRVVRPASRGVVAALAAGITALTLAPAASAAPPDEVAQTARPGHHQPLVTAHRGSSAVAPENTVAATREAVRHRSDVVEIDIQRSRDGALVLVHDTSLARTTDVEEVFPDRAPWNVGDFTLAELRRLDAGSWFDADFAGERIPTLSEWGRALGQRARMLLEVKSPALYPGIEADLDRVIRTEPAFRTALRRDRLVVQSFDHPWLRTYERLAPQVPVGLLFGSTPTPAQVADAAQWAEQVNPALAVVGEADVAAIHAAGMEAHVWTVNDGAGMRRAIRWQVDGIITNYPQVLRDLLAQRAR